jgi:hypothetical protein
MAGGGSTLRGVPEQNSIAPFILSTNGNGKTITHQGKRGTFAVMTDGSVRFIDQKISDEVFKAMCTVKGPALDLEKNEWAPLVSPQKTQSKEPMREESKTEKAPPADKKEVSQPVGKAKAEPGRE